jgi:D-amino-acid dehydrogenase
MQAGKGYSLTLPDPVELPKVCSILVEAKVAVTPIGSALRFGGTMQLGELNESIDPRRLNGILKSIPRYMPKFKASHFEGIEPWVGLRPVSPDGLPYIGRPRGIRNLVVATGHAMMGVSLGPITGDLVAEILDGQSTSIDLQLASVDRFKD